MTAPRRLAVIFDAVEERWPSMELVAQMLLENLCSDHAQDFSAQALRPHFIGLVSRFPGVSERKAWNANRFLTRFVSYPAELVAARSRFDLFHVADHSYSQLLHALPAERTGVFCHDLDAYASLLTPGSNSSGWRRAMARIQLSGLQRAAIVFYSTEQIRTQIVRHDLLDQERLVRAPYGVSPEFFSTGGPEDLPPGVPRSQPYLLHVGSSVPRKRLDVLLKVFAAVRKRCPDLLLVQQGATLLPEHRKLIVELGIGDALLQPPTLSRKALAALYRHCQLLLLTSEREGFGLPLLEAFASGAPVLASDIPAFREVGATLANYCPVGNLELWTLQVLELLSLGRQHCSEARRSRAAEFSWTSHAARIADAYRGLASGDLPTTKVTEART